MFTAVTLLAMAVSLLCEAHSGCASSGSADAPSPPAAQIIYSASMKADYKYKLCLANWPNPKPKLLNPKVIGKYGLGETILHPVFSPDGTRVLFLANRRLPNGKLVETDGYLGTDIWVLDVRANTVKPLTTDGHGYEEHHWSPDGRYVCAISHEGCPPPEAPSDQYGLLKENLYVWDTKTGKRRFIAPHVTSVVWGRDGRSLYYNGDVAPQNLPALLRISRDGGKPTVILSGSHNPYAISPDSRQYAFWEEGKDGGPYTLCIRNLETDEIRQIMKWKDAPGRISWSPDGKYVATWLYDRNVEPDQMALGIVEIATGKVKRVPGVVGVTGWPRTLDWIITEFSATTEMDSSRDYLAAVSVDTGKRVTLIHPPQEAGFDWRELPAH